MSVKLYCQLWIPAAVEFTAAASGIAVHGWPAITVSIVGECLDDLGLEMEAKIGLGHDSAIPVCQQ